MVETEQTRSMRQTLLLTRAAVNEILTDQSLSAGEIRGRLRGIAPVLTDLINKTAEVELLLDTLPTGDDSQEHLGL